MTASNDADAPRAASDAAPDAASASPPGPGPDNALSDVAGLAVGHATDERARTGVTVILCDRFTTAGVDVRGGGPATRETDALSPSNLVGGVHALALAGGSVFGLAAADGVVAALSADGVGLTPVPAAPPVPIVPAACIYDLAAPGEKAWGAAPPYRALGLSALAAARDAAGWDMEAGEGASTPPPRPARAAAPLGAVGAGRGAVAGAWKGGVGAASLDLGAEGVVAALIVANPVGSPLTPDGQAFWASPLELMWRGRPEFTPPDGPARPVAASRVSAPAEPFPLDSKLTHAPLAFNTTIGVVACSQRVDAAGLTRIAAMAQSGLARAVRPAHTPYDGDTIFALSTGAVPAAADRARALARIGAAAADCVARAVTRAVAYASAAAPEAPVVPLANRSGPQ